MATELRGAVAALTVEKDVPLIIGPAGRYVGRYQRAVVLPTARRGVESRAVV